MYSEKAKKMEPCFIFLEKKSKRTEKIPKSKKDGQEMKSSKNKFHVPRTAKAKARLKN